MGISIYASVFRIASELNPRAQKSYHSRAQSTFALYLIELIDRLMMREDQEETCHNEFDNNRLRHTHTERKVMQALHLLLNLDESKRSKTTFQFSTNNNTLCTCVCVIPGTTHVRVCLTIRPMPDARTHTLKRGLCLSGGGLNRFWSVNSRSSLARHLAAILRNVSFVNLTHTHTLCVYYVTIEHMNRLSK